ncbi:DUF1772 domain-containing protein [Aquirhabdus sp.]|uniref:anthrone oxygenase family protein n=1 Tax=Aquirhabdus sp. TaxID=2824160 RepID=UPI00396C916F
MTIIDKIIFPFTLFGALGSGLVAGIFFAFSNFVMTALARIQPVSGIAAMQSINIVVLNPLFMFIFMGTALISIVFIMLGFTPWRSPNAVWLGIASVLYLGCFIITATVNVPLNDTLAAVDPNSVGVVETWRNYVEKWTLWNHVRTICSLAASGAFVIAIWTEK